MGFTWEMSRFTLDDLEVFKVTTVISAMNDIYWKDISPQYSMYFRQAHLCSINSYKISNT